MSLKGYQWLDKEGKVLMSFDFNTETIDVWQDVDEDNYMAFYEYIRKQGFTPHETDCHYNKIGD